PGSETGSWMRDNSQPPLGAHWKKISQNATGQDVLGGQNVTSIVPDGPNTLFVTTSYASLPAPGDVGVWRAVRQSGSSAWSWESTLNQNKMTSLAISPNDSSILYAFSGQWGSYSQGPIDPQQAGIWKSLNGGKSGSWTLLANNGLEHLKFGRLTFSRNNSSLLYAATQGGGLFEGTISCTDPVRDFECSTRINPSNTYVADGNS